MFAQALLAFWAMAAPAPHTPIGRVLVLQTTAPSLPAADRDRSERRMEAVLRAGDLQVVGGSARTDARACETQVCRQRTAVDYGITHWVHAEIAGDDREYRVRVTAGRMGESKPVAQSSGECTICGVDDLAASVEARTDAVRAQLEGEGEPGAAPSGRARSLAWRRMEGPTHADRKSIDPLRPTGIALLALGSAGVVGGAVLLGIDGQEIRRQCGGDGGQNLDADGDCRFVHETRAGGIAMLTGGVLAVAGGITLVTVERNRRRRADLRMRVGWNRIVLAGRF